MERLFDSMIKIEPKKGENLSIFLRDIKEDEEKEIFCIVGILNCDTNEHIFSLSRKKAKALKKMAEAAIAKCLNKKKVVVFYDPEYFK